jgi:DNA polymerase III delta prime subunit
LTGAVKDDRVVIVFHELDKYEKSLDKLWMVMDRLKDELLVIITTNYPMKFENAIRSRCAKFNFTRITPDDFHSRAQEILREEDLILPDADVLHYLKTMTISTSDMRDYYEVLDELLFMSRHQMSLPAIPTLPLLTIAK